MCVDYVDNNAFVERQQYSTRTRKRKCGKELDNSPSGCL